MLQLNRARRTLRRLAADRGGLALIEFAICLPVLLTLGLGGIEVAHFAIANLRISQIAMTTADNAGRVRDSMTEADVNELLAGAKFVGKGIGFGANGRIVLSDLEPTKTGGKQWIRWQRCTGALDVNSSYGTPLDKNGAEITSFSDTAKATTDYGAVPDKFTMTEMGPTGNKIAAVAGSAVMFVEITYNYQPIVANRYLGARQMKYTGAFNVRQRNDQTLKRAGVTTANLSTCDKHTA